MDGVDWWNRSCMPGVGVQQIWIWISSNEETSNVIAMKICSSVMQWSYLQNSSCVNLVSGETINCGSSHDCLNANYGILPKMWKITILCGTYQVCKIGTWYGALLIDTTAAPKVHLATEGSILLLTLEESWQELLFRFLRTTMTRNKRSSDCHDTILVSSGSWRSMCSSILESLMLNDSCTPPFVTKGFLSLATMKNTSAQNAMIPVVGLGGAGAGLVTAAESVIEVHTGAYDGW